MQKLVTEHENSSHCSVSIDCHAAAMFHDNLLILLNLILETLLNCRGNLLVLELFFRQLDSNPISSDIVKHTNLTIASHKQLKADGVKLHCDNVIVENVYDCHVQGSCGARVEINRRCDRDRDDVCWIRKCDKRWHRFLLELAGENTLRAFTSCVINCWMKER